MDLAPVPGFAPSTKQLRARGIAVIAVVLIALLAVWGYRTYAPKDQFTMTIRTPVVAAGIIEGAKVRLHGLDVGQVSGIDRLGNGQQGVTLQLNGPDGRSLTNNVEAAFSAGNLFGVSEVILTPHDGGGPLRDGAELSPTRPITDNTVSALITQIGDLQDEAIRPNGSTILQNFDASSKALMPVFTALGNVAQAVQDTQKVSTSQTFPTLARTLASADSAITDILPAARTLFEQPMIHDSTASSRVIAMLEEGINDERTGLFAGALRSVLTPSAVNGLKTATPLLVDLLEPILGAFPNGSARGVGVQISDLLNNVRAAMPNTPNGTVLNVRLQAELPAVAAMLPSGAATAPR